MMNERETTTLWDDFEHGRAYQHNIGLTSKLPLYVRFYEGDQWPKPTKRTKNLPRPVINITKMICRNKKSSILSTPVRVIFKADDQNVDVEKLNRFSEYIQKELGQEALDKKGISDGVKKGGYFYHYYWDSEARGKRGRREGGLRCEMIDALNIFFADPTELDEQKQKWILIASRETVDSVKAKCDPGVDQSLIGEDEADDPYASTEQEGSKLVTVLTRYFRVDGEVYIEKATKRTVINKPFPLTPDMDAARAALKSEEDAPNNSLPDKPHANSKKNLIPKGARAYLYPIVVGNYEERERCIYGLGEIDGLIQNQRSINFNVAMMLLAAQEVGWGKFVVTKDALQGQTITNEPGQVLTDHSKTGNGIKRLEGPKLPSAPSQLVDMLMQMTRVVTGSSEVMTGETIGANMSGAAIAQIQSQALQPVEELKNTFWLVKEKQGRVLAQFYKLYYTAKTFTYSEHIEGAKWETQEEIHTETFNSSEYADVDFDVVVESVGGTNASVAGDINALDTALANGAISPLTYFELFPKDALSNRTEILRALSTEEANKVKALETKLAQLTEAIKVRDQMIAEQQKTVERAGAVIRENQRLKSDFVELYVEAAQKIRDGNVQIELGNSKIREMETDATNMAQFIAGGEQSQASPINNQ